MMMSQIKSRIHKFKRWQKSHTFTLSVIIVFSLASAFVYAMYMANQRLSVNPESYTPILELIARVESGGNYNAYFGNTHNNEIKFTEMSIAEVQRWQVEHITQGNPSSAVGKYQIISETLDVLVKQLNLPPEQKFNASTQDSLAIALLERRGSVEYVNNELSPEEFAANLAQEWAALPKVVGENPNQSYYAGDGINKSLVEPEKVLQAISPIEPN